MRPLSLWRKSRLVAAAGWCLLAVPTALASVYFLSAGGLAFAANGSIACVSLGLAYLVAARPTAVVLLASALIGTVLAVLGIVAVLTLSRDGAVPNAWLVPLLGVIAIASILALVTPHADSG